MQLASDLPTDPPSSRPRHEDPRRALGRLGENLAAAHLQRLGFAILERNARTRHGEIDLIVSDGHDLVFVEVKTRRSRSTAPPTPAAQAPTPAAQPPTPAAQPLAWLRTSQRARLRRLAAAWLRRNRPGIGPCPRPVARAIRFDAVGVVVDEADRLLRLDHIESAW